MRKRGEALRKRATRVLAELLAYAPADMLSDDTRNAELIARPRGPSTGGSLGRAHLPITKHKGKNHA